MGMGRVKGIKNKTFHRFTKEELEYLREISYMRYRTSKEIRDMMEEKFRFEYTLSQIKSKLKREKIKTGINTRFAKGHTPYNKGKKISVNPKSVKTQFKKGNTPHNTMPIGTEVKDEDGYTKVKIADPNIWEFKHRLIYKKYKGDIPEGSNVIFKDKNKENFNIDNLMLVTREKMLYMNKNKLIDKNPEITEVGATLADIVLKVKELRK